MPLIPTPTYITNCSKIKSDPYWKWIMSNPESWRDSDRNHVIFHLGNFKPEYRVQLQQMYNDELFRLLEDCVCLYATTASETNTCVCVGTKNLFARELKKYNQALLEKTRLETDYNKRIAEWELWKGNVKKHLEDEKFDFRNVAYNPCSGDLKEIGRPGLLDYDCRRHDAAVSKYLGEAILENPKPQQPVINVPKVPVLNLLCCSQNFSNLVGTEVRLKDISQECKLSVINTDSTKVEEGTKGDTTDQAKAGVANKNTIKNDDNDPLIADYTLYIILAILVCISCCCSSIILLGGGYFAFN